MAVHRMLDGGGNPIVGWPEDGEDQPYELVKTSNGLAGWRPASMSDATGIDQVGGTPPPPEPVHREAPAGDKSHFDISGIDQT